MQFDGKRNRGLVRVDHGKLKRQMLDLGLSELQLAVKARVSAKAIGRINRGRGIRPGTLALIAGVLNLKSSELVVDGQCPCERDVLASPEWECVQAVSESIHASNGLEYQIWRMRHRHLPDTFGRGRRYQLDGLATRDHEQLREQLLRHSRICRRFRGKPQIPVNLAVYPENADNWWIVDEWTDGATLEQTLQVGPLLEQDLPRIMRQIAEGLRDLHRAVILRRELSPRNVLIRQGDGAVLLTDFELGKFLDKSPTVSTQWPDDPYRAPEVATAPHLDGRADLFSWGRICLHAAIGELPPLGEDVPFLARANLPAGVRRIVERCLQLVPDDRPASIEEVLRALDGWH